MKRHHSTLIIPSALITVLVGACAHPYLPPAAQTRSLKPIEIKAAAAWYSHKGMGIDHVMLKEVTDRAASGKEQFARLQLNTILGNGWNVECHQDVRRDPATLVCFFDPTEGTKDRWTLALSGIGEESLKGWFLGPGQRFLVEGHHPRLLRFERTHSPIFYIRSADGDQLSAVMSTIWPHISYWRHPQLATAEQQHLAALALALIAVGDIRDLYLPLPNDPAHSQPKLTAPVEPVTATALPTKTDQPHLAHAAELQQLDAHQSEAVLRYLQLKKEFHEQPASVRRPIRLAWGLELGFDTALADNFLPQSGYRRDLGSGFRAVGEVGLDFREKIQLLFTFGMRFPGSGGHGMGESFNVSGEFDVGIFLAGITGRYIFANWAGFAPFIGFRNSISLMGIQYFSQAQDTDPEVDQGYLGYTICPLLGVNHVLYRSRRGTRLEATLQLHWDWTFWWKRKTIVNADSAAARAVEQSFNDLRSRPRSFTSGATLGLKVAW